jgi:uncharacterized protein YijF (DUF1287 family)
MTLSNQLIKPKTKSIMKKIILLGLVCVLFSFTRSQNKEVIDHAIWQTTQDVTYDGSYVKLDYPNGDVPANKGVCTDVIIRAYRAINVDLQSLIHRDMKEAFPVYCKRYKSKVIDKNIDHRRTQNMQTYFTRQGAKIPVSYRGSDYKPGDIVFWSIANGHVGMVVDKKVPGTNRYYVVHNIGSGPKMEDFLFGLTIVDHYRWNPTPH